MPEIDDGGLVFPGERPETVQCDGAPIPVMVTHAGMSFRAYAATHALAGLISNGRWSASDAAERAVKHADALIAELKKEPSNG